jgi:hypothetical protein
MRSSSKISRLVALILYSYIVQKQSLERPIEDERKESELMKANKHMLY